MFVRIEVYMNIYVFLAILEALTKALIKPEPRLKFKAIQEILKVSPFQNAQAFLTNTRT